MKLVIEAEKGDKPVWGNTKTAMRLFAGLTPQGIQRLIANGEVLTTKLGHAKQAARMLLLFGEGSIDDWLRRRAHAEMAGKVPHGEGTEGTKEEHD